MLRPAAVINQAYTENSTDTSRPDEVTGVTGIFAGLKPAHLPEIYASKIRIGEFGCWEWEGWRFPCGYGRVFIKRKAVLMHRLAYTLLIDEIPSGLDIDHLCRNRSCVNPAHLEPVTRKENLARSPITRAAIQSQMTHCKRGHALHGENMRFVQGGRRCRTCERARAKRYYREAKARQVAA